MFHPSSFILQDEVSRLKQAELEKECLILTQDKEKLEEELQHMKSLVQEAGEGEGEGEGEREGKGEKEGKGEGGESEDKREEREGVVREEGKGEDRGGEMVEGENQESVEEQTSVQEAKQVCIINSLHSHNVCMYIILYKYV